jgi:RimJ/RimL family protein N-acetyltransferase
MLIKGKQVKLRPLRASDYLTTVKWRHENELRMLAQFHLFPITEELEKEWIESILKSKNDKDVYFAIEEITSGDLLGYFQLRKINWTSRTAYLGIIIGKEDSRGKGYGKEVMELGLDYAFNFLNLRKISLEVLTENKVAVALYKKSGFVEEGLLKRHYFFDGKYYDVKIMAIFNNQV